jgi:hypothetical protein
VDDAIVWDIVTRKLPVLANEVEAMIDYDARHVDDIGMAAATDASILALAAAEQRVVVIESKVDEARGQGTGRMARAKPNSSSTFDFQASLVPLAVSIFNLAPEPGGRVWQGK